MGAAPPNDAVYAEVAEEPALALDALDGPEELLFGRIASVDRDDQGNLVVADVGIATDELGVQRVEVR